MYRGRRIPRMDREVPRRAEPTALRPTTRGTDTMYRVRLPRAATLAIVARRACRVRRGDPAARTRDRDRATLPPAAATAARVRPMAVGMGGRATAALAI